MKESLEWGTKIVGGVKPGVEGEHLGLPVFPSVRVVHITCVCRASKRLGVVLIHDFDMTGPGKDKA